MAARISERTKLLVGALSLVGVLVVGGALGARRTRPPESMTLEPASRSETTSTETSESPIAVPPLPEVPTLPAGAALSRGHGEGASAEEEAADLGAEMRLMTDARRALRGGEPSVALSLLDQHRERFAHGALSEEREAYAVLALRTLGHTDEAERRLTDFHAEHPGSSLLDRVLSE